MNKSRCWVEVSRSNLKFNVAQMMDYVKHDSRPIAIVKADGYGHGALEVSRTLNSVGVTDFGVACVDEGEVLRNGNINGTILILSYVDEHDWKRAHDLDLIMSIVSTDHAERISRWAREANLTVKCELKLDTGMRRLGVNTDASDEEIRKLFELPGIKINGIYTHLCCADSFVEDDKEFTRLQNSRFAGFVDRVKKLGYETGRTHVCASSGVLNFPEFRYDHFRPGFMLYGYTVGDIIDRYETRPVLSFYSKVEHVKMVKPNEGISYGRLYFTDKDRKIATVACGYADGYPRNLTGKASVIIRGHKVPIVGRICMDQFMVDVTGIPDVCVEDVVTLIGSDGNEKITMEEVAEWSGSVGSEIASRIMPRSRRYYKD